MAHKKPRCVLPLVVATCGALFALVGCDKKRASDDSNPELPAMVSCTVELAHTCTEYPTRKDLAARNCEIAHGQLARSACPKSADVGVCVVPMHDPAGDYVVERHHYGMETTVAARSCGEAGGTFRASH